MPGDATSVATAINAHGVVVGTSTPAAATYVSQAFVYADGKVRGIPKLRGLPGFVGANAQGVNDSGAIVGSVGQKSFISATSSYVFDGKTLTPFATNHGFGNSQATAINARGVVTGYHSTFSFSVNAPLHAYAYSTGTFTDLATLYPADGFANSVAFAIDKRGLIVGYSQVSRATLPPHATAFANGRVTDLNTLLPAKSGWLLEIAEGIDDEGNIVGIVMHGSVQRGFILRTGASYAGLVRRARL